MKHYQPGKMGVADVVGLTFIFSFPVVFLTTPALLVNNSAGLAWLDALLNGLSAMAMLITLIYVYWHVPGDMYAVCEQLLGCWLARIIMIYYSIAFFSHYVLVLRQYAENTLLTALPYSEFSIIIAAYALVIGVLVYIGVEGISRVSYLFLPFIIVALLFVVALLIPFYNVNRLAPFAGMGVSNSLYNGLASAGVNIGVMVVAILAPSFQNTRTMFAGALFGLGMSSFLRSLAVMVYVMVFGVTVGREKILPFFEMARTAYLSRYVQRIESLFIVLWVISGVLALAIDLFAGLYCLTRLTNMPALRPLIPIVTLTLAEIAMVPPDIYTAIYLFQLLIPFYNIGIYIIPVILLAALLIKRKGKVKNPWAADSY